MSNFYKSRKTNGYSQEEAYFARIDRELIKKIREDSSAEEGTEHSIESNVIEASHRFQKEEQSAGKKDKKAA